MNSIWKFFWKGLQVVVATGLLFIILIGMLTFGIRLIFGL